MSDYIFGKCPAMKRIMLWSVGGCSVTAIDESLNDDVGRQASQKACEAGERIMQAEEAIDEYRQQMEEAQLDRAELKARVGELEGERFNDGTASGMVGMQDYIDHLEARVEELEGLALKVREAWQTVGPFDDCEHCKGKGRYYSMMGYEIDCPTCEARETAITETAINALCAAVEKAESVQASEEE